MILIVGNNHDDVLYYESKLRNKTEEKLYKRFSFVTGTLFSQKVGVVYGVYTNYVSSMIVSEIIKNNHVVLVINVGRCQSLQGDIKVGDVAISRQVYLGEVSLLDVENSLLGQVPGFPQYHLCDHYALEMMNDCFNRVASKQFSHVCSFISLERYINKASDLDDINLNNMFFGQTKNIVFDNNSGGISLACTIHDVPMVSVKIVESYVGEPRTLNGYVSILKKYSELGKAVTACIGEISRNEVIMGKQELVYGKEK